MKYDALIEKMPQQSGDFAPCFAFSVHKSGSSLLEKMILMVCKRAGLPAVSIPGLVFNEGHLDTDWKTDPEMKVLFTRNLVYYGFRFLPTALTEAEVDIAGKRFTLLVRDPRDALVSQYFSFGKKTGSHVAPKNNQDAFKAKMAANDDDTEIDDYVLRAAPNLLEKLSDYRAALNFDLGLVARYEDVFFDKQTYLAAVFAHFGLEVAPQIIAAVAEANDVRPEKEDETQHIRKGTPGDHAEKLRPETIAALNDIFRDVGAFYGYEL